MPKRKSADRTLLTTTAPFTYPTLQAILDAQPSLIPDPSVHRSPPKYPPPLDDVDFSQYLDLPDEPGLDVEVDDSLIDPALLEVPKDPPSTSASSPCDPPESEMQLVNDYRAVESHSRPYICRFEDCDKAFARKSDLARHFRIHTNERGCGKSFIQRSALTVHHRVHTGSKPYACTVHDCEKAFARRNSYLKHHKREHPEEPEPSVSIPRAAPLPPPFTPYHHPLTRGRRWPTRSSSAPHGFAASHPSEGAAYVGDGFGGYNFGGGGEYDIVRVGGGAGLGGDKPYRFPASPGSAGDTSSSSRTKKGKGGGRSRHKRVVSIAAPASAAPQSLRKPQQQPAPAVQEASPHPSLASDDSDDDDDGDGGSDDGEDERDLDRDEQQPGTPLLAVPLTATTATFSDSGSAAGLTFGQPQYQYAGPHSAPIRSDGIGPRQVLAHGAQYQFGTGFAPDQSSHQAPPGMILETKDMGRTVSSPAVMRSPDEQVPWVGGGFSASQLSIPHGHSGYYPPLPPTVGNTPLHTAVPSPVERQNERRLTDPDVPSFSFQAPGGTAVMVPVSAIQNPDFSMLNTPVQPVTMPQHEHDQPQTAPPSLTRFNSAPIVPTRNGINVNEWLSTSTGPVAGPPSADANGRFPILPSVSATLSAIADQSPLSSVPTDAPGTAPLPHSSTMPLSATVPQSATLPHSATMPLSATLPSYAPAPNSGSPATDSHGHWGAPIAFPAPPRDAGIMPPPFIYHGPATPALTSGATASTFHHQNGLGPIQQGELYTAQHSIFTPPMPANPHAGWTLPKQGQAKPPMYKPYAHAPYSAHAGLYNGQLSPFTPVTAQSHMSAGYQMPYTPHTPQHFQFPQQPLPMRNEQTITLSTPPRGRPDRTVSGMTGIGLGLANVSFGDRGPSLVGGVTSLMTGQPFRTTSEHIAQTATRQPLHPMLPPQIQHPPPPRAKQHPPVAQAMDANMELRYAMEQDEISSDEDDDEYLPDARPRRKGVKNGKKHLRVQGSAAVSRAKGRSV